ncbi:hypothetical protein PMAYCL1PPCAC_01237, partial [Pristionchus mayeri]
LQMQTLFVLLISSLAVSCTIWGHDQSVGARGTLMCGNQPLAGAMVKLWDKDRLGLDDLLAETQSNPDGTFQITGTENEIGKIDPILKVYHECNNKYFGIIRKFCYRKHAYKIPKEYINKGRNVNKWYEFGVQNFEAKIAGEDTECFPNIING